MIKKAGSVITVNLLHINGSLGTSPALYIGKNITVFSTKTKCCCMRYKQTFACIVQNPRSLLFFQHKNSLRHHTTDPFVWKRFCKRVPCASFMHIKTLALIHSVSWKKACVSHSKHCSWASTQSTVPTKADKCALVCHNTHHTVKQWKREGKPPWRQEVKYIVTE